MSPVELKKWKARGGAAPKVVTVHGARPDDFRELVPATMQFKDAAQSTEVGAHECSGCIFRHQPAAVCAEAARLAVLADMRDCDDGAVYVGVALDPRQMLIDDCEQSN